MAGSGQGQQHDDRQDGQRGPRHQGGTSGALDTGPQVGFTSDHAVAYAERWTETAYHAVDSGLIIAEYRVRGMVETEVVSGPCPRCSDQVLWRRVASAVRRVEPVQQVQPVERTDEDEDYRWLVVTCGCGRDHAGHPKGVSGCGATYRVPALVVVVGPVEGPAAADGEGGE